MIFVLGDTPECTKSDGLPGLVLDRSLPLPFRFLITCALSVGLLFCPFCFCCGWLVRCVVLAFCTLFFEPSGARARTQPQNAAIHRVLLHLHFSAGLRAVLFDAVLGARERVCPTPAVACERGACEKVPLERGAG